MKIFKKISILLLFISYGSFGQNAYTSVPKNINKSDKYLFYLHGKIVEDQGVHSVSSEYGPYEYLAILDTLVKHGYNVISEARPKNTDELTYAIKVTKQIDTLLKAGVLPENIIVVGASKGAYISLLISVEAKNAKLNFAILGICDKEIAGYFRREKEVAQICGNFLSIYEVSDSFGKSCEELFMNRDCVTNFQEVKLTMNIKHGFLYKPYSEWVVPLFKWASQISPDKK
jgi:hypothetical protein